MCRAFHKSEPTQSLECTYAKGPVVGTRSYSWHVTQDPCILLACDSGASSTCRVRADAHRCWVACLPGVVPCFRGGVMSSSDKHGRVAAAFILPGHMAVWGLLHRHSDKRQECLGNGQNGRIMSGDIKIGAMLPALPRPQQHTLTPPPSSCALTCLKNATRTSEHDVVEPRPVS